MTPVRLVTLDLATCTGWAAGDVASGPSWGHIRLPKNVTLGGFLLAFERWLVELLAKHGATLVVYEAPFLPKKNASIIVSRKLIGLCAICEKVCAEMGIKCREVDNQEAKKFFTGRGGSKVAAGVMNAALARGWKTVVDDEADALAIWTYSFALLDEINGTNHAAKYDLLQVAGN